MDPRLRGDRLWILDWGKVATAVRCLWTSGAGRRSRSEQRAESFLGEVLVVGQHLCQPLGLHGVHRNAVCETVALVETSVKM